MALNWTRKHQSCEDEGDDSDHLLIEGRKSALRVHVGGGSKRCPQIIGSNLGGFNYTVASRYSLKARPVFDWLNTVDSGAWLALIEKQADIERRPTVVIQGNLSGFHKSQYQAWYGSEKVWRDWWFATLYSSIELLDEVTDSRDLAIWHPILSSNPWGRQMHGVLLEVLGHLVDIRELDIEDVYLCCTHDLTLVKLERAAATLSGENIPLEEPVLSEVTPSEVGCPEVSGTRIFHVPVRPLVSAS